ncbi:MAG: DUF1080 domain-containing protein [Bryobacteraceae bacterium]
MRLAILFAAALACQAQNTLTPRERAQGWILLFDGKSLDAWEDPRANTPPGDSWSVEDGCIKSAARPKLRQDLISRQSYGDFDLAFDWRIAPKGNSGVKYRIQDRVWVYRVPGISKFERLVDHALANRRPPQAGQGEEYGIAFEYQVIDYHGDPQSPSAAGALYELIGPSRAAARPVGEFNQARIVVKGNHIEHWLNGSKVVDAELTAPEIAAGLARRWSTESPVYRMLTGQPRRNCPIALQNHNSEAWFRNIRIRPLR